MKHIQGNVLKRRGKKNQSGRSMVEMLGVLAIIGVLSVGGIAGYRYAMDRITLNKMLRFPNYLSFLHEKFNMITKIIKHLMMKQDER